MRPTFHFCHCGNAALDCAVAEAADDIRTRRALDQKRCLRGFVAASYETTSWNTECRVVARIEATAKGLHIRVVTSVETGRPSICKGRSTAPASTPAI